ncbi:MAG: alpha/beta fold hydrolase [Rhodospirillales bacterium]|nr:alpha/beta fold hydrolase [Alphaproteobacteria bacterium]MBL6947461.1 alpha/beta fold hydrolase [Rhodospirillales bacterium]
MLRFLTLGFCFAVLALPALPFSAQAKEVKVPYNGLTVNANLNIADGKKLSDGVVLMLHGTLAHKDMEIMRALQDLLLERGFNNLAFNLSLAQSDRHGMNDCAGPHEHKDSNAVKEIAFWINWLKGQGAGPITVLGHSRGGNQVARYVAASPDTSIKRAVLVAPGTWEPGKDARGYKKNYKKDLGPLLAQAELLTKGGKGDTLMEDVDFVYCPKTKVDAASFYDYYRPNPDRDTPSVVDRAKVPVLVVGASNDQVSPHIISKMKTHTGPNVRLEVIQDAGHFFRDLVADELADIINDYIGGGSS